ncbi:MAG TPA: hypothetical protein VMU08_10545 [Rhizomicrobium sp.]|nr:hypothetical protein [Rhizomicrobium sp.]
MGIPASGYHAGFTFLKRLAAALPLAVLAAVPARGAGSQQALFDGYVASPAYRAILQKAYNDYEPAVLKAKCRSLTVVSFDPPEMVDAYTFVRDTGGWRMSSGAWVARATLDACGTKVVRRALVESASNNTLRTRALLPGEYGGGLKLEEPARGYVIQSMLVGTGCKDWRSPVVLDVRLKTPPKPKGWTEVWTAFMCGKTVTARVDYVPDATRGTNGMSFVTRDIKAQ